MSYALKISKHLADYCTNGWCMDRFWKVSFLHSMEYTCKPLQWLLICQQLIFNISLVWISSISSPLPFLLVVHAESRPVSALCSLSVVENSLQQQPKIESAMLTLGSPPNSAASVTFYPHCSVAALAKACFPSLPLSLHLLLPLTGKGFEASIFQFSWLCWIPWGSQWCPTKAAQGSINPSPLALS